MKVKRENEHESPRPERRFDLRRSAAAKITALVLLFLMCAGMIVSFMGIFILEESDAYGGSGSESFYETDFCDAVSSYYANELMHELWMYGHEEVAERILSTNHRLNADNTNFLFVVTLYTEDDSIDRVLLQNCDGEVAVPSVTQYYGYYHETHVTVSIDTYIRYPMTVGDGYSLAEGFYNWLCQNKVEVVIYFVIEILLAIACFVFLLMSAGRRKNTDGIQPNFFDRIPLDLYTAICIAAVAGLAAIIFNIFDLTRSWLILTLGCLCLCCIFFICIAFILSLATRWKLGKFWRNTIIYRFLRFLLRIIRRPLRSIALIFRNLSVVWKGALALVVFTFINVLLSLLTWEASGFAVILLFFDAAVFICFCLILLQLDRLKKGGARLAAGDLNYTLDTKNMLWDLRRHGENLNSIAEGMNLAVERQLKSERFKTELITNVSHDIKTPLTSIINYVDLLKKEELNNPAAAEYLSVLDRQSARLKKLTEDLVEASKASSGVTRATLTDTDIGELLNQAVGEYRDRLMAADIEPIVTVTENPVILYADGKLMWRVFDNLLSNICKYSLPGTRAYFNLDEDKGQLWIMFKNISRNLLNISSEELMERFVRGDEARSSEGSGLGLSIARSLTELQGGDFKLFIDGDLFKVILTFPLAQPEEDSPAEESE